MKTSVLRFFTLLCVLCSFIGTTVFASAATITEEDLSPYASAYLSDYTAWAARSSDDDIYIYYDVTGAGTVGCLGAKLIVVEMNDGTKWTPVHTRTGTVSNGMLLLNTPTHGGGIVYEGTSGNQYRAVVTIFGGSSTTSGDSRIVTTNTV